MIRFFVIWLAACGVMAAIISTPFWADRAIVALMRNCRIYAYPTAIRIATRTTCLIIVVFAPETRGRSVAPWSPTPHHAPNWG